MRKLEILERVVLSELENWYVLIDYYPASDLPKLVVSFEDLLSRNGLSIVNDELVPLFGIRYRFDDEDSLRRVADFGRESQLADVKTLSETVYRDNKLVSDIVRSAFDYNEILARLGLSEVEMAS